MTELTVKTIMEQALETPGGLIIRSVSKSALIAIRWRIYSLRKQSRSQLRKLHNVGHADSHFDPLCVSIRAEGDRYAMRLYKEEDLFTLANAEITIGDAVVFK